MREILSDSCNDLRKVILDIFGLGTETPEPEPMSVRAVKTLIFFASIMGVTLFVSNLAALKIWCLEIWWPAQLFPFKNWEVIATIPVDAGIWLFPITYVLGDLLIAVYGKRIANLIAVYASLAAVGAAMILWLAGLLLPDYPGVDNGAFLIVQDATGNIFLASVAGFCISQVTNNRCFVALLKLYGRHSLDQEALYRRCALLSSVPAHIVDCLLFEFLAFWGRVTPGEFARQAIFAFGAGVVIEALLSWKLTPRLIIRMTHRLQYCDGKYYAE